MQAAARVRVVSNARVFLGEILARVEKLRVDETLER
jgi:hypothetical protein